MRTTTSVRAASAAALALAVVTAVTPAPARASSHNEAPYTSTHPITDDTDFYAFRDPNDPAMINFIACRYGLIEPQGGPNYANFLPGAWYDIKIDNDGDGQEDITYRFTFSAPTSSSPSSFLYALPGVGSNGSITQGPDPSLLVTQTYNLDLIKGRGASAVTTRLVTAAPVNPPNIGPKTFPKGYINFANGIQIVGKRAIFVGPRQDPFFVDLGATFDGVNLEVPNAPVGSPGRPGVGVGNTGGGKDTLYGYTVLATSLQVPIAEVTQPGFFVGDPNNPAAIIGAWASISIPKTSTVNPDGSVTWSGEYQQVSRLGNPLVNEVLVGYGSKDAWNASQPKDEANFKGDATHPGELYPLLATYMNVLFGIPVPAGPRVDIQLALFQGIPSTVSSLLGVAPTQRPGEVYADELRINTAVPPTSFGTASRLGYLGGDPAGFPNGRRPCDDVVDIAERVVAGVVIGLLPPALGGDPKYAAFPNNSLGDGVDYPQRGCRYFFPYMWSPTSGFAALHTPNANPTHAAARRVNAIKSVPAGRGFPEGISDEEFEQLMNRGIEVPAAVAIKNE